MLTVKSNIKLRCLAVCAILLIATLLAACDAPAAAPTATPIPPTPVPPTATPLPPTTTPTSQPVSIAAEKGRTETSQFTSPALADNLLDYSTIRPYSVYLPPGYDNSDQRYPTLYVLPHYGHRHETSHFELLSNHRLDKEMHSDKLGELIAVFTDGGNMYDSPWYRSNPVVGDWESHIADDLVNHIDSTYRTIPHRDSRALIGATAGANGALHIGLVRPNVFGVVVSMGAGPTMEPLQEAVLNGYQGLPYLWASSADLKNFALGMAAAGASNPDDPPHFLDEPVVNIDGEWHIVPEVWERISSLDIVHDLDPYLEQPVRLNALLTVYGEKDRLIPVEYARKLDEEMTKRGIDHEYVELNQGRYVWDARLLLDFISDHLVFEE